MRRILFILVPFLLLVNFSATAQKHLKTGYIITLSGDTVHGFIDLNQLSMNPTKVHFIKSYSNETQIFEANEIRLFSIEGDIYEGAWVDLEISSKEPGNYSTSPELNLERQLVFLQLLIKGPKSLYANGNAIYEQFYIKTDSAFELLAYKKYYKDVKDASGKRVTVIQENKRYQGQLIVYLSDCNDIKKEISRTDYSVKDLEKLFFKYYECKGQTYDQKKAVRNFDSKMGASYGVALSGRDFDIYTFKKSERVNYSVHSLGFSVDLRRPISYPQWSVFNELNFNTPCSFEEVVKTENVSSNIKLTTSYNFFSIKLIDMLRYRIVPDKKVSYFVNMGIATEFHKGKWKQNKTGTIIGGKINTTVEDTRFLRFNRIVFGGGVKYRRYSIEARFETGNSKKNLGPVMSLIGNFTF